MICIIYMLVVLLATTIGASVGLGGGVIIKPLFDLVNFHNASTIGFYSSCAVFTMSVVSIFKAIKRKARLDYKIIVFLALGSILGGFLGDSIFVYINDLLQDSITIVQNIFLGVILFLIIIYTINQDSIKSFQIKNPILIMLTGLFLGTISVFLGIGGGPLNLAILGIFFGMDIKKGSLCSIGIIFFSQITKLAKTFISNQFKPYDLKYLIFILPAAILGGIIGSAINKKSDNTKLRKIYIACLIMLVIVSIINIIKNI